MFRDEIEGEKRLEVMIVTAERKQNGPSPEGRLVGVKFGVTEHT